MLLHFLVPYFVDESTGDPHLHTSNGQPNKFPVRQPMYCRGELLALPRLSFGPSALRPGHRQLVVPKSVLLWSKYVLTSCGYDTVQYVSSLALNKHLDVDELFAGCPMIVDSRSLKLANEHYPEC